MCTTFPIKGRLIPSLDAFSLMAFSVLNGNFSTISSNVLFDVYRSRRSSTSSSVHSFILTICAVSPRLGDNVVAETHTVTQNNSVPLCGRDSGKPEYLPARCNTNRGLTCKHRACLPLQTLLGCVCYNIVLLHEDVIHVGVLMLCL